MESEKDCRHAGAQSGRNSYIPAREASCLPEQPFTLTCTARAVAKPPSGLLGLGASQIAAAQGSVSQAGGLNNSTGARRIYEKGPSQ